MLEVWKGRAGLRHSVSSAVRVCAAVGDFSLLRLRDAPSPVCGVRVEAVPRASGKNHLTDSYAWFLARWAKGLSWQEVAEVFHTSWPKVFRSAGKAVEWGRAHQDLNDIEAIGIDEIQWQRGHRYLTLVYQIDAGCRRLLWIGKDRKEKTLKATSPC